MDWRPGATLGTRGSRHGRRSGNRHRCQRAIANLRTVLSHAGCHRGAYPGGRTRSQPRPAHRPGPWREHRRAQRARDRQRIHRGPAGRERRTDWPGRLIGVARPRITRVKRLLLIEDEPGLVLTLRDRLSREGYAIETSADGESGLERASREVFDLVLL